MFGLTLGKVENGDELAGGKPGRIRNSTPSKANMKQPGYSPPWPGWRHTGLLPVLLLFPLAGCSSDSGSDRDPDAAAPDAAVADAAVPPDAGDSPPDATPGPLEPGTYLSPLVQLQRLQGEEDHLHVDEIRLRDDGLLLQCSYTFGVLDATNAGDMEYLAQNLRHNIPGDTRRPGCIHLASDGDFVFTTHRGNIRNPTYLSGWDITDREAPVQLPVLQEAGVSYEGIDFANGHIVVGLHETGLGVYTFDVTNGFVRVGLATGFTNAWGVVARGNTVFVADSAGGLVTVDVTDPANPTVLGQVVTGGQATGVDVDGNFAYVASGSAGLVVVDVSDLANPKIVGSASMRGSAVRVAYSDGRVAVAAWNDARIYDVSNPASPSFIGAVRLTQDDDVPDGDRPAPTSRVLGIELRGSDVFVGNWHVLYSYRLHAERKAPNILLPEAVLMMDFGPLAVGQSSTQPLEVTNQGTAPLTLVNTWVFGDAYTVTPQQARIEPGESAVLTVTYTATKTELETGYLQVLSDDPQAPLRAAYLVGNQPGLGVGMTLPETDAVLLDGEPWSSSQTQGNVVLLAYFATF
jgi:LVIVD repeat/Abnormal spindle-like microcephaly-assoc'd, ASPM-SPD-2-Hydin